MNTEELSSEHRWSRFSGRAFILGAGVSASCGVPVAKDILRSALENVRRRRVSELDRIHRLLEYLYPDFDRDLRNYPNVEDFLNLISMAKRFNNEEYIDSTLWTKRELSRVHQSVLTLITEYLWKLAQKRENFDLIRQFAANLISAGDVVITFNWDVTIEQALHLHPDEPTFDYSFPPKARDADNVLLKPHGSIDWFRKKNLPSGANRNHFEPLDHELSVYTRFDFSKCKRLFYKRPIIVPPVWAKDFKYAFLRKTWISLYRVISQADDLHILGYSLPPEDQFARLVLRRALRNNLMRAKKGKKKPLTIEILNPEPGVLLNFSRLLGAVNDGSSSLRFLNGYFADYVRIRAGTALPDDKQ